MTERLSQAWRDGYTAGWEAGQAHMHWQLQNRNERGPIPQQPACPYDFADLVESIDFVDLAEFERQIETEKRRLMEAAEAIRRRREGHDE